MTGYLIVDTIPFAVPGVVVLIGTAVVIVSSNISLHVIALIV